MKIGIVSDSHGKTKRLAAALELLAQRGVEAIVHCGDVSGAAAVELLALADAEAYVVAGNMDRHIERLAETAEKCGVHFAWETIEVPLPDGRHLIATHGNDPLVLGALIVGQQFPYVCHGHTHRRRDERIGQVRVINPGALHHPRGHQGPAVAILDTEMDDLEWIELGS